MEYTKWIYHATQQMKPKLIVTILFVGTLVSLSFIGCGIFVSEGEYEAPQVPKSELATIKIDTEGGWLQRYNLIVLRIGGKVALREKIRSYEVVLLTKFWLPQESMICQCQLCTMLLMGTRGVAFKLHQDFLLM